METKNINLRKTKYSNQSKTMLEKYRNGYVNPNRGRKLREETKIKIGKSSKNWWKNPINKIKEFIT